MPTFDVDRQDITAFEVDGAYLFKQYFDQGHVFNALELYHYSNRYRFEIPGNYLDKIKQILDGNFYDLRIEDGLSSYCVVKQKDSNYRDILKNSVLRKRHSEHIIFLMKDRLSVKQTIENGATPLTETDIYAEL